MSHRDNLALKRYPAEVVVLLDDLEDPAEVVELLDDLEEYRFEESEDDSGPIPNAILRRLLDGGYVSSALEKDDPVVWLSEITDALWDNPRPALRKPKERVIEPDWHLKSLARIAAADARRDADVEAFRRVVLRGRLLKPHRLGPWIAARKKREGPPTQFVELPMSAERIPQSRREIESGMRWSLRVLRYELGTGDVHIVPVVDGGHLDALRNVAEGGNGLAIRYGWNSAYVPRFVLTDEPPPISRASATVTVKRPFPAAATIKLELSPRMKPDEVRALYVEARNELVGGSSRVRPITERHAELAVMAFEHRDGWKWKDLMTLWNKRFPKWEYRELRNFNRDALLAYRRVTGERLDWIGETP